jgi:transcriptional regulator with XRE-family HTH domain
MISVAQLRAARALLGWTQDALAARSGVSKPTIARLELSPGEIGGYAATREKLIAALEAAGVIFVAENGEGPGVRLRKGFRPAPPPAPVSASERASKRARAREKAEASVDKALGRVTATDAQKASRKRKLTRVPRSLKEPD